MKQSILILLLIIITSCSNQKITTDVTRISPPEKTSQLKIGSFNIQIFGTSKMGKSDVVPYLVKIIKRYDIILIQEIRNADGSAILDLMEEINKEENLYSLSISSRTGRTTSKEQHAYIYKKELISVLNTYEIPDTQDVFEREPYSVLFKNNTTGDNFVLIGLHIKPTDSLNELNHLKSSYSDIVNYLNNDNVILMGDFNSDCTYLTNTEFDNLDFTTDNNFTWQFSKSEDTTTSSTDCAYDQIITNTNMSSKVKSKEIFNYESFYGITNSLALDISDHYPISVTIEF